jgi:hypothetical protein
VGHFDWRKLFSSSAKNNQNSGADGYCKWFATLSNGFSKRLENNRAAVSLYVSFYNLVRQP